MVFTRLSEKIGFKAYRSSVGMEWKPSAAVTGQASFYTAQLSPSSHCLANTAYWPSFSTCLYIITIYFMKANPDQEYNVVKWLNFLKCGALRERVRERYRIAKLGCLGCYAQFQKNLQQIWEEKGRNEEKDSGWENLVFQGYCKKENLGKRKPKEWINYKLNKCDLMEVLIYAQINLIKCHEDKKFKKS